MLNLRFLLSPLVLVPLIASSSQAQIPVASATPTAVATQTPTPDPMAASVFSGLKFRPIGPAVTSGRVIAFAVDPGDRSKYYVAVASGGVWKTVNSGTTWSPVFENEGAFSIGAITLDPKNPSTVWVGTGERNSQRSVAYGDGVYRSDDGGKNWKNVGLKTSEHIGRIAIDPRDSNIVFVAAQGPLWSAGSKRPLQDDRWWQELETGDRDQREYGRHGRGDRSIEPGHNVRSVVAAEAAFLHPDKRWPGECSI